ncbi:MAG: iron chelate uptake ABC transporter family permease subunit [Sphingobacterium sp.]|uniref:ABC transporter permease n=1 Tax=unclassified Sphingobacterium TaxID=2609468 RepID=UPI00284585D9|nr:iron chelate uptake ABC transporter family permease subunit [Sphingobacterium sp.]MDR3008210.1 iron chelate uptake ABC transporter family permease subunit [Sphingobacterium sp.]
MNKNVRGERPRRGVMTLSAVVVVLILAWISLFTGARHINFLTLLDDRDGMLVFLISRIPRTAALILVGIGSSIAGLIMQQLSQNRFVSPTTSGALDAAKMGILMAMIGIPDASLLVRLLSSLGFTFLFTLLFILFVSKIQLKSNVFIPLVGIMFGSILNALSTFFAFKNNIVQNVQEWLLGDFSAILQGQYEAIYFILPAVAIAYLYAEKFTLAGMGRSFAVNLGLSYTSIVNIGLLTVSMVVSVSVITVGVIPFVGLIIPNLVRLFLGDNIRKTLPIIALSGAIFLLLCDIFGRLIVYPYEIPIGVTVGAIGGLLFLFFILRKRG